MIWDNYKPLCSCKKTEISHLFFIKFEISFELISRLFWPINLAQNKTFHKKSALILATYAIVTFCNKKSEKNWRVDFSWNLKTDVETDVKKIDN